MIITSLALVNKMISDDYSMGLSEFQMENLGPIVLLAGPNGGGNTRLLRLVEKMARLKLNGYEKIQMMEIYKDKKEELENRMLTLKYRLEGLEEPFRTNQIKEDVRHIEEEIQGILFRFYLSDQIRTNKENAKPIVVNYCIRQINLEDPRDFSAKNQRTAIERIASSINTKGIEEGLKAIHALQEEYIHVHSSVYEEANPKR